MITVSRLTVGLPVYNGENYLAESLDALLGQSYENFELIISDNASTDGTAGICQRYQKQDPRIRYIRQPHNIGGAPNHNHLVEQARAELFKWAWRMTTCTVGSAQALRGRAGSIPGRRARPFMDGPHRRLEHLRPRGRISAGHGLPERARSGSAACSMRSAEMTTAASSGPACSAGPPCWAATITGSDPGGRTRAVRPVCAQVPDWLYSRRDHPARAERAFATVRTWCANLDPRRSSALRNPAVRLYAEYVWGFVSAIRRAPLPPAEKRECYQHLARWLTTRANLSMGRNVAEPPYVADVGISLEAVVPGWERRPT